MSSTRHARSAPWEAPKYRRLESAAYHDGQLHVRFADGTEVAVDPSSLLPRDELAEADWDAVSIDGPEIVIPAGDTTSTVGWLDVRALTDSAFAKHLAEIADEEARQVGQRIRFLRESRNLASAELSRRAQITPQSLSRIERGRHDVVYSTLQRLLAAMNYSLADLAEAPDQPIDRAMIAKRLRSVGLPREVINRVAPQAERPAQIVDRIQRIFGWSGFDLTSGEALPLRPHVALAAQFKSTAKQRPEFGAYVLFAHYLAVLVDQAATRPPARDLPEKGFAVREEVLKGSEIVSFEALLRWAWGRGIAVLPLVDPGQFHGACWLFDGRPVIVLKQMTAFDARLAFNLAHEIGHVALHLSTSEPSVVESDEISYGADDDSAEDEAGDYAGEVVLGAAEDLALRAVTRAGRDVRRLQRAVTEVATEASVSVGALADYVAWRVEKDGINWWGSASKLQAGSQEHAGEVAVKLLQEHLDLEQLADDDRELLLGAIGAS